MTDIGLRVRAANERLVCSEGRYVLYWMIAARRPTASFALDRAIDWAQRLNKPLIVLEALRVAYPYASDRLHSFVLDGMRDNALAFADSAACYYPYVETQVGAGKGLLQALSDQACVVVTDEFPCFFLPRMVKRAAGKLDVLLEVVDSNGLLPLALAERAYSSAHHFRRFAHQQLPTQLRMFPRHFPASETTLARLDAPPERIVKRWPSAPPALLSDNAQALAALPIDHHVKRVARVGGAVAAAQTLRDFVAQRLDHYGDHRNDPDRDVTSRLSPYLHFGHLSAHQIVSAIAYRERWTPDHVRAQSLGSRTGWWGLSEPAEAFLDELVTWRELAYNTSAHLPAYDEYYSLPQWARATLAKHSSDPRKHRYTQQQFEAGETHDPLWNAAQRQLLEEGWFHNYMRMLWAKKILEWSATPQAALRTMSEIMNRWSLDGRSPNSYAGYFWTLGRYDRPWPERAIYGTVRSMSSENTARKVAVDDYVTRYQRESAVA